MLSTKTRTAIIAFVASASFAGASLVPTVASALPAETAPRKGCVLYLKDQLGGEKRIEMDDGDTVKMNGHKYKCVNGNVIRVSRESPEGPSETLQNAPETPSESPPNRPTSGMASSSTAPAAAVI